MAKNNGKVPRISQYQTNIFLKCPLLLKEINCNYFFKVRKKSTKNLCFTKSHWNLAFSSRDKYRITTKSSLNCFLLASSSVLADRKNFCHAPNWCGKIPPEGFSSQLITKAEYQQKDRNQTTSCLYTTTKQTAEYTRLKISFNLMKPRGYPGEVTMY